jgi:Fe2+ transport system protein FeoA
MKKVNNKCEAPRTLGELQIGQSAIVSRIGCSGAMKRHLIDMGVTPGVKITLHKCAPLGDPLELKLRGYTLSVRRSEAQNIYIESESI